MRKEVRQKVINEVREKATQLTPLEKETLIKLEDAFRSDLTTEMAAQYAGIGRSTLYLYFKTYPDFKVYLEELRNEKLCLAHNIVTQRLNSSNQDKAWEAAKWLLERRDRRYSTKSNHETEPTGELIIQTILPEQKQEPPQDGERIMLA